MSPFRYANHRKWKEHHPVVRVLIITGWTLVGIAAAVGLAFLLGLVVRLLWNHVLMAAVPGLNEIGYLQAVGLVILAKILFGGMGGHGKDHRPGPFKRRPSFHPGMHRHFHQEMDDKECGDWDWQEFWDTIGREAWKDWVREEKLKRDREKSLDPGGPSQT